MMKLNRSVAVMLMLCYLLSLIIAASFLIDTGVDWLSLKGLGKSSKKQMVYQAIVPEGYIGGQVMSVKLPSNGNSVKVHIPIGLVPRDTFYYDAPRSKKLNKVIRKNWKKNEVGNDVVLPGRTIMDASEYGSDIGRPFNAWYNWDIEIMNRRKKEREDLEERERIERESRLAAEKRERQRVARERSERERVERERTLRMQHEATIRQEQQEQWRLRNLMNSRSLNSNSRSAISKRRTASAQHEVRRSAESWDRIVSSGESYHVAFTWSHFAGELWNGYRHVNPEAFGGPYGNYRKTDFVNTFDPSRWRMTRNEFLTVRRWCMRSSSRGAY